MTKRFDTVNAPLSELAQRAHLDPIQNNCTGGWVLPDRCRYNPRLGCPCGAYPPLIWCKVCIKYVIEVCSDAGVCSPDLRRL